MNNDLTILNNNSINLWDCPVQLQEVKDIYGKNLSNGEFRTLVQIGKATGLNPFMRELWAIKFGDNPAQIFVGRDGFRRSAQANPNYDYHHVEAVYSNDNLHYDLAKGEVNHTQDFKNRGNLVGAYCIVKRKSATKPVYVFVDLKEYTTGKSLWGTKPATMIKKVAEAQCLRMAFQELFGGVYAEEEVQEKDITPAYIPADMQPGKPLSQSFKMDEEVLEEYLTSLQNSLNKEDLQLIYNEAKVLAKGDKIASNKVSIATKARLEELKSMPTREEIAEVITPEDVAKHKESREAFYAEWENHEVKK